MRPDRIHSSFTADRRIPPRSASSRPSVWTIRKHFGGANGADRATLVTSFSIAKSLTSLLIGIAIAEGRIRNVDDPITLYLPELARRDARFAEISLRHLLMMASSKRIRHTNAYFTGIGKVKMVVIYDTLIEKMDHDEVLLVLVHEAGHWKKRHIEKSADA